MKFLFSILIVFLLAVVIALAVREDPGYVVINYRDWTLETSLILAVVAAVIGFSLLYVLVRLLINIGSPRHLSRWRRERRHRKAHRDLDQGIVALVSGRWMEAERKLIAATQAGETPLISYLFAARAAEKLGASQRRDKYLELARESMPGAEAAVGLTRADLYIQQGNMDEALRILEALRQSDFKQEAVTKRLLSLYRDVREWDRMLRILPSARRYKIIDHDQCQELETEAYCGLMVQEAESQDLKGLLEIWSRMPKRLRQQAGVVGTYAQQLIRCNAHDEAERVLQYQLARRWNEDLAYLYGVVQASDALIHLSRAENLFKTHQDSQAMLLTLGRLYKRNAMWEKARQCLEAYLALHEDNPEALSELAEVLEQLGENKTALEYYRKGMLLKMPEPVRQLASAPSAQATLITAGGSAAAQT